MLARIKSVVDPSQITYIVSNHSEMDGLAFAPTLGNFVQRGRGI